MADPLNERFFTHAFIHELSVAIAETASDFDSSGFEVQVLTADFDSLALKQKMRHVTTTLHKALPQDYPAALSILLVVAPRFNGFNAMLFPDFVEVYGLAHWDLSMTALAEFTQLCSSEFAVRPFIATDWQRAMAYLYGWSKDENEHLRRLSSEGCRPRLPWAGALPAFKADPRPILPILETLKADGSEYVRKSVANNLNDISKDNPEIVLDLCRRWRGESAHTDWILKRGCRTLLKAGNTEALILFGFGDPAAVSVQDLTLDDENPAIGDMVQFNFDLHQTSDRPTLLRLEYAVTYMKASEKRSRKIFQIGEGTYEAGIFAISRKVSFADLSTRRHYPGEHQIAILVNGVEKASTKLHLHPESVERSRT